MTCRELLDFLMDYCDGVLPAEELARFEEHLGECPACVAYLDNYKATIRLGKAACTPTPEELCAGMPEELVQAILAARKHI